MNESVDITELPFNRFIGITRPDPLDEALLQLDYSDNLGNHLNTIHASAQFALAEAAAGECLLRRFFDYGASASAFITVVREVRAKYRKPATGTLRATATISDDKAAKAIEMLAGKGRTIAAVDVDVLDETNTVTMCAAFSWFIQKRTD